MTADDAVLVFDTGPLSHFAKENWLGVLKAVVGSRRALIPDMVADELRIGVLRDGRLGAAFDAPWTERRELRTEAELIAFARFSELLVVGDRNRGEAAVLALAATSGGVPVIDDGAARQAAKTANVSHRGTVGLLCAAIRLELLTIRLVSALADDLIAGQYRLPFGPGEFEKWALDHGLLT